MIKSALSGLTESRRLLPGFEHRRDIRPPGPCSRRRARSTRPLPELLFARHVSMFSSYIARPKYVTPRSPVCVCLGRNTLAFAVEPNRRANYHAIASSLERPVDDFLRLTKAVAVGGVNVIDVRVRLPVNHADASAMLQFAPLFPSR